MIRTCREKERRTRAKKNGGWISTGNETDRKTENQLEKLMKNISEMCGVN